ncbi:hypothetical protein ZWY2020_059347 [Hordeum vulgare]|nr:hypothetical protein ZWY2020_059347 [Hordeum vulgare]
MLLLRLLKIRAMMDDNVSALYKKISGAQFTCPSWFFDGAKRLIPRILDPNPSTKQQAASTRHRATTRLLPCRSVVCRDDVLGLAGRRGPTDQWPSTLGQEKTKRHDRQLHGVDMIRQKKQCAGIPIRSR